MSAERWANSERGTYQRTGQDSNTTQQQQHHSGARLLLSPARRRLDAGSWQHGLHARCAATPAARCRCLTTAAEPCLFLLSSRPALSPCRRQARDQEHPPCSIPPRLNQCPLALPVLAPPAAAGKPVTKNIFPLQYAFNLFSHNSPMTDNGYNEEEMKLVGGGGRGGCRGWLQSVAAERGYRGWLQGMAASLCKRWPLWGTLAVPTAGTSGATPGSPCLPAWQPDSHTLTPVPRPTPALPRRSRRRRRFGVRAT